VTFIVNGDTGGLLVRRKENLKPPTPSSRSFLTRSSFNHTAFSVRPERCSDPFRWRRERYALPIPE